MSIQLAYTLKLGFGVLQPVADGPNLYTSLRPKTGCSTLLL